MEGGGAVAKPTCIFGLVYHDKITQMYNYTSQPQHPPPLLPIAFSFSMNESGDKAIGNYSVLHFGKPH